MQKLVSKYFMIVKFGQLAILRKSRKFIIPPNIFMGQIYNRTVIHKDINGQWCMQWDLKKHSPLWKCQIGSFTSPLTNTLKQFWTWCTHQLRMSPATCIYEWVCVCVCVHVYMCRVGAVATHACDSITCVNYLYFYTW